MSGSPQTTSSSRMDAINTITNSLKRHYQQEHEEEEEEEEEEEKEEEEEEEPAKRLRRISARALKTRKQHQQRQQQQQPSSTHPSELGVGHGLNDHHVCGPDEDEKDGQDDGGRVGHPAREEGGGGRGGRGWSWMSGSLRPAG